MKRIILIGLVAVALLWIGYSSYKLWFDSDQFVNPKNVFCSNDEAILVINDYEETKSSNYFDLINENPLKPSLLLLDSVTIEGMKIYVSKKRPIVIFEKETNWNSVEKREIEALFKLKNTTFTHHGTYFMVAVDYTYCSTDNRVHFGDADKKASANYWQFQNDAWKKTDMYNLRNGFYEYRSEQPLKRYGKAVRDIPLFSSVIPNSVASYVFNERFYAEENDSIFRDGVMNEWVDQGFVMIDYEGKPVVISDYRSQQSPRLVLIEKSNEDSIISSDDIYSFTNFQLTKDFPSKEKGRFYIVELEDKVLITETKETAQKLIVNYQLGKTLALSSDKSEQFFGGLPSLVNSRFVSNEHKESKTWKKELLFEVATLPPVSTITESTNKDSWSASTSYKLQNVIPIKDHLRQGISVLAYSETGKYTLFSPGGAEIWKGEVSSPIIGEVKVVDVFDNNKFQFLFRTKRQIHLIDLNGREVGGFPYQSDNELTTDISEFVWNGTKRFLVGSAKGEVIMINNVGQELNIIQVGNKAIHHVPYALNVKGNLRVWAVDADNFEYLGYLETPAKAQSYGNVEVNKAIKYNGRVLYYFEKTGEIYVQKSSLDGTKKDAPIPVGAGKILAIEEEYIALSSQNRIVIFDHKQNILQQISLPFNEIGEFIYYPSISKSFVLDYLQNKIHAYDNLGNELTNFPKEGKELLKVMYDTDYKKTYIYSLIAKSIICYKI